MTTHSNRLKDETSPYLLQHAHNPVAWYPWAEEALKRARDEDKPILLSIGYSACHWCHVMAHESFEDEATAQVMNELFINIKVDREERPDLDKIYQLAHSMLTRRGGGWPLTVFLTPSLVPYFAGTYFPPQPRYGMPSFAQLLHAVADYYRQHRDEVAEQSVHVLEAFEDVGSRSAAAADAQLGAAPLDIARNQLAHSYDRTHGGFGGAPKFPHPTHFERLLRHWAITSQNGQRDAGALEMVEHSLVKMADGGIYDQLGGGFCRYSVDERWMIPHFEKMLYDNGPLLALYANAWRITGNELFRRVAAETARWAMREMQTPEGGYCSSLDADSEGEEGKFYVWDREEIEGILNGEDYPLFARRFGLDQAPNFESKHWHLHVHVGLKALGEEFGLTREEVIRRIDAARAMLWQLREKRVRPGRDDKILTSWNALMIKGMFRAGRVLDEPSFAASAERALDFIHGALWSGGRLLASYKDGRARHAAYLDDYAFLLDAILESLASQWNSARLAWASALAEALLAHFEDRAQGGFYFTADDHEALIHRPKPTADEALPSGNGVAAHALLRLGHLTGNAEYLAAAERALRGCWNAISELPYAHGSLLAALEEWLYPPQIVVIRQPAQAAERWLTRAQRNYAPRRLAVAITSDTDALPEPLQTMSSGAAYVCSGFTCSAPIERYEDFVQMLEESEVALERKDI